MEPIKTCMHPWLPHTELFSSLIVVIMATILPCNSRSALLSQLILDHSGDMICKTSTINFLRNMNLLHAFEGTLATSSLSSNKVISNCNIGLSLVILKVMVILKEGSSAS